MTSTKVSIYNYGTSLNRGIRLLERFKKINGLNFQLDIKIDFSEPDLGRFNYDPLDQSIYVNPVKCENKKFNDLLGHPTDCSVYATLIHETGHNLDRKYFLVPNYHQKNRGLKRLIGGDFDTSDIREELADILTIYLTNPYYLKLIDKERYCWLKSKFKSPTPCGYQTFLKLYNRWPKKVQDKFCTDYNIKFV